MALTGNAAYAVSTIPLRQERSISHVKQAAQDRLPQHDPLPAKMAASQRGFSSVELGSRVTPINRNHSRRRNPMPSLRPNAMRIKRFCELKAILRTARARLGPRGGHRRAPASSAWTRPVGPVGQRCGRIAPLRWGRAALPGRGPLRRGIHRITRRRGDVERRDLP